MPIISISLRKVIGSSKALRMLSILGTKPTEPNSQPRHLLLERGLDIDERVQFSK